MKDPREEEIARRKLGFRWWLVIIVSLQKYSATVCQQHVPPNDVKVIKQES